MTFVGRNKRSERDGGEEKEGERVMKEVREGIIFLPLLKQSTAVRGNTLDVGAGQLVVQ